MYKKAQAAMEFLMTYGWAILVVLIAIGALTYLVDFGNLVGNRCQLTAPLYCQSYKAEAGSVTLLIKNGLTEQISVNSINLVDETCPADTDFTTRTIASGKTTEFKVDCNTVIAGEKVKTDILISYDETNGLGNVTASGNVIASAP